MIRPRVFVAGIRYHRDKQAQPVAPDNIRPTAPEKQQNERRPQ